LNDGSEEQEMNEAATDVREKVRASYAEAAKTAAGGGSASCGPDGCGCGPQQLDAGVGFGRQLYEIGELSILPDAAGLASLGCGNPIAVAELREGETVLDLGSGGGIDVLLSAKRVGSSGRAIGLDMTDEMLELARRNAADAGATNVEFRKGTIEDVPLPEDSVDVIISNCVINLSTDKPRVLAEMLRVLRPGGRLGITDVVADDALGPDERAERGSFVGCIAGALSIGEYERGLRAVGFADVRVEVTHDVADQMYSAIVRATKPDVRRTTSDA
jgi:ubiquinone/menaquinone biosynthesis C-methylase UbiE